MKRHVRATTLSLLTFLLVVLWACNPVVTAQYPAASFAWSRSSAMITEQAAFSAALRLDPTGVYLLPGDFTGAYFNARNGIRRTVGQPVRWTSTLYLLGPSTVLDIYNPDGWTIASQLQRLLPSVRVVNLGIHGGGITAQFARLKTVTLQPGDTVVLYTGDTERRALYFTETARIQREHPGNVCGWLLDVARSSQAIRAVCGWYEGALISDADLAAAFAATLPAYLSWIDRMQAYTFQAGAAFAVVVSPCLMSKPLSAYEQAITAQSFALEFNAERVTCPLLAAALPGALDLSRGLDAYRDAGHEVYYADAWHLTGDANARIAEALYARLVPLF